MSTIYVVSDYGRLVKKGQVLQLKRENDVIKTVFPFKTEQLLIIGKIEITSPALRLLMRHKIDAIFLGSNGRFNGKIAFQAGKNVFLRQQQFKLLDDEKFKLSLAKSIVKGKLKNQLSFMQRIIRKSHFGGVSKGIISKMKNTLEKVNSVDDIDRLRGYEGIGARYFFSVFKHAIIQDWAVFSGRSMNPPQDNVNAVLSFIYTMILFRVDAAIETEGFDSYAGYFHCLDYGKRSLAFDLMEEYRTPIGDMLTVSLFNLAILKPDDFHEVIFSEDSDNYPLSLEEGGHDDESKSTVFRQKRGVLLTKDGLKKVITHLEKKINSTIYYQPLLKKITYKVLIHEQVKHFKRLLTGQEKEYKPLVIK